MKKIFFQVLTLVFTFIICEGCLDGLGYKTVPDTGFNASWFFVKADSLNVSQIEKSLLKGVSVEGMQIVRLPHTANLEPLRVKNHWQGVCFYMKKFIVNKALKDKMLSLYFEGAVNVSGLWINGEQKLSNSNLLQPFEVPFKPLDGENCVVVKLDNRGFNTYGGICRNVRLCAKDSLSQKAVVIKTSDLTSNSGTLTVSVNVENAYSEDNMVEMRCRIYDHNRKTIGKMKLMKPVKSGSMEEFVCSAGFEGITLWDIDNPWLYILKTDVVCNGEIIDSKETEFGFRDVEITSSGIKLNGKKRFLRGVDRSQEYPYVGYAISDEAHKRDAYRIKNAGFDFVKTSKYPQAEAFLKACDKYGILVLNLENNALSDSCLTIFDYNGDDGSDLSGLMTINRRAKFPYYLFRSQRDIDYSELKAFSEPICYIASYWIPNESKGVTVYSNGQEVELFVDGNSLGKQKPLKNSQTQNLPHPPFYFEVDCKKQGTLKAVSYDASGSPVAECTVKSPLNPVRLKIVLDESGTLIAGNDVILVHCYILDKNGTIVSTSFSEVEFSVSGTAEVLSPKKIKAEAGVATALIRIGKNSNDFTVSAKCGSMYTVADR